MLSKEFFTVLLCCVAVIRGYDCNLSAKQCAEQASVSNSGLMESQCYIDHSDVIAVVQIIKPCAPLCRRSTLGPNYKCLAYCSGFKDLNKTCPDNAVTVRSITSPVTVRSTTSTVTVRSTTSTGTVRSTTSTVTVRSTTSTGTVRSIISTVTSTQKPSHETAHDSKTSDASVADSRTKRTTIIIAIVLSTVTVTVAIVILVTLVCVKRCRRIVKKDTEADVDLLEIPSE